MRTYSQHFVGQLRKSIAQLQEQLKEGNLTEEACLNSTTKLLNTSRDANTTIRWLMLHTAPSGFGGAESNKRCRQAREQIVLDLQQAGNGKLLELLLYTAEFELKVKDIVRRFVDERDNRWSTWRCEARDRLVELAEVFGGEKPLMRVERNEKLQKWFRELAEQVDTALPFGEKSSNRKAVQIIRALEQVQAFHQLESNMQVRQFLEETRASLLRMVKSAALDDRFLTTLQIVGDLSYGWIIIDNYTQQMQEGIRKRPSLVSKLRATFLKLASALDAPLLRINQANSVDLVSVSQYYSSELVAYVRKVLQIIPRSMFGLLSRVIDIQTNKLKVSFKPELNGHVSYMT